MNLPKPTPFATDLSKQFALFSRVAAVVVMLGSASVLLGWWLNIAALKSVLPHLVSMKPNTALCLMLLGCVLWLRHGRDISMPRRWSIRGLSSLVVIITGLTLLQYLLSSDFGIDQWLFLDDTRATKSSYPGRMAVITAIALGTLALAILSMIKRPVITRTLAVSVLILGMLGITGYLFGAESMYRVTIYASMAIHTAVFLVLLSVGILMAGPAQSESNIILLSTLGDASARALTLTIPMALVGLSVLIWLGLKWQWFDPRFGLAVCVVLGIVVSVFIGHRVAGELTTADNAKAQVQAELRDLNQRLEQTVTERTASLQQLNANLQAEMLERKQTEDQLQQNAERTRRILSAATVGLWEWHLLTDAVYFSPEWKRILGCADDEIVNRFDEWQVRIHPDDLTRALKAVDDFRHGRAARYGMEIRMLHRDGAFRWTYNTADLEYNDIGEPVRMMGSLVDITERKLAEVGKAQLAAIVESSDDAIISKGLDAIILTWNQGAEKLFGYSALEVIGQPVTLLFPADKQEEELEILARIKAGQTVDHFETVRVAKDGRHIEVSATISPIRNDRGQIIGASKIVRDISEQKRAEAALIAAQKEAVDASQELARSNADLEQFAYVASHDLMEPLRSVASSVQLLKKRYEGQLDARADEFIEHAVSGALRMQTLIEDLLTFSRVSSKQGQTEEVSMEHALNEAVRNLKEAISASNAKITHDPLPNANGHGPLIIQLLQNLIANAIKFRGDKAALVHVGGHQVGSEYVYSVADQGIGIDSQHFERVFDLFKRLHSQREYAGTGIGLALCKKIVERHGGRIWVESEPDRGTTFFFTLAA